MGRRILVDDIIQHNSREKNIVCCIEEMSELTKVLTKKLRMSPKFTKEKLTEEIAHVLLMCHVIAVDYNISEDDVFSAQQDAVQRMKEGDE